MFIYLIEIEWPEVKNFNDPGEGARGAVSEEHNLQAACQEGAVKEILFQESLERPHKMALASDLGNRSRNFVALTLHSLLLEISWLLLPSTTSFYTEVEETRSRVTPPKQSHFGWTNELAALLCVTKQSK